MDTDVSSTIVAVSSGIAPGERGIVRISGNDTQTILEKLLDSSSHSPELLADAKSAKCFPANLRLAAQDRIRPHLDSCAVDVLCYWWPDTRSFTGEPSAEIHLLGSLPLLEMLVERVQALGACVAGRGEFTLRSFLAGKIDLTQAEAVLGVIEAESESQLEESLGQLAGNLSNPVRKLREKLIELVAHLEAGMDFVEEDIEFISRELLESELKYIHNQLSSIANQLASRGSRARNPVVVLVGLPNAGKSTLFNCLVGEDRAIVSRLAGTTRDALTAFIDCGGLQVEIVDTAGIEELSEQSPRALAQSILATRIASADLILFCVDSNQDHSIAWLDEQLRLIPTTTPRLIVGTKSERTQSQFADFHVSQQEHQTILSLKDQICIKLRESDQNIRSDAMHFAMMRSRRALELAAHNLQSAIENNAAQVGEELVTAELRFAIESLAAILGEIHSEDILDNIFSRFCIGK